VDISIALPNTLPGTSGQLIARWASRAEERGFAGIAATERLVYPGHDPLLSLAAAAAVTSRIRLATNIIIGPLRSTAELAKAAETLQSLSGGRFVLGLGPGVREDDFAVAGRSFAGRGAVFDAQLAELRGYWSADAGARREGVAAEGTTGHSHHLDPAPPRVPLLVAGLSHSATRRVVRWGDGWTAPGLDPTAILPYVARMRSAWAEAGRPGDPHVVALLRFVLGDDVKDQAAAFVRDYFAVTGEDPQIYVDHTPSTGEQILALVSGLAAGGVNEIVFHPTAAALNQVDRLAEIVIDGRD
jgi:alkanesulfonate monooxygenase SsuD/methylene tetrahydromethanopterin reductase-like flavin-dependent oxidoreductase (luciferase family)